MISLCSEDRLPLGNVGAMRKPKKRWLEIEGLMRNDGVGDSEPYGLTEGKFRYPMCRPTQCAAVVYGTDGEDWLSTELDLR